MKRMLATILMAVWAVIGLSACDARAENVEAAFDADASVKYGDVNQDGEVTFADAQLAMRAALRIDMLEEAGSRAMDVNGDGSLDLTDVLHILKKVLRVITEFPIEDISGAGIPQELETIPEEYFAPAGEQGMLVELYYNTYESKTYEQHSTVLRKRAIVYLPYGYSEEEKYNVFYLMHGGWSNETTTLGTPDAPAAFKNVIDHAIADGKMKPMIIVCPTYNNESPEDSSDYTLAFYTLTVNYHNELMNDLIPAVEGAYSTYAEDTSLEAIRASRDHRGFGGFSMGSVTTWHTFINCLDAFRYFMPMSGAADYNGMVVDAAVTQSGYSPEDFFIYAMTGTDDFERSNFTSQIEGMLDRPSGNFIEADNENDGNLVFRIKEGYSHDARASMEYTYNGLRWFWSKDETKDDAADVNELYTADTKISEVMADPVFGDYGRMIFPVNEGYYSGNTLGELRLTWYNNIDKDKTVEIVNYMKSRAQAGDTIFYDIYTEAEKAADPAKKNTGLFFFKGKPGERFAICNAGGGFAYVRAMHDSFPHALELSKKGYNAFALIYRPGAQTACEDLARAIRFIFEHTEELDVNTDCYSLWGGSAGARMAAQLGSYGTAGFGEGNYPQAGTVIMQYTGHSDYTEHDPPTYVCVGENDGIANWRTMENRINNLKALGIDTEFHRYPGLGHGFGLGTGTVAEGWFEDAVAFWERQISK